MTMQERIEKSLKEAKEKYMFLAEGRQRIVFLKDNQWVIKVPKDEWGLLSNEQEFNRYKLFGKIGDIVAYAECYLQDDENGISLLVMEKVEQLPIKDQPDWAKYVDCGQVGKNTKGEIVAYDYADD